MRETSVRAILIAVAFAGLGACSWGSDSGGNTGPDAGVNSANQNAKCGDGVCAASEVDSCAADCGQPGGGGGGGGGGGTDPGSDTGSNSNASACGDFVCDPSIGENATTCPADCSGDGTGGSDTGGGGSGALDCSDENTVFACIACEAGLGCSGVDANSCAACGF
jgi:hypothetical protein